MITLSEFMTVIEAGVLGLPIVTSGVGGARLGKKYSKEGKSRLEAAKKAAIRGGLRNAAIGGTLGLLGGWKSTDKLAGLKSAASIGGFMGSVGAGSSAIGSQLGYREKYKKQYNDANPNQRSDKGVKRGSYNK